MFLQRQGVGYERIDAFRARMRFAFANTRRFAHGEPPLERVPRT